MKGSSPLLFLALACLLATASAAISGQISWNSYAGATNLASDGEPLDGSFVFELGTFSPGFTPTEDNLPEWLDQWVAVDRVRYNDEFRAFSKTLLPTTTYQGQAYIWGYKRDALTAEWILITNPAWRWPPGDLLNFPQEWSVNDASEVILGDINGDGFHMKTAAVDLATLTAVLASDWTEVQFGESASVDISGWHADPDADGLSNLLEFAFDLDPWTPEPNPLIQSLVTIDGNAYLQLAYPATSGAGAIPGTLESSHDLQSWQPVAGFERVDDPAGENIVYLDTVPISQRPESCMFLRLRFHL